MSHLQEDSLGQLFSGADLDRLVVSREVHRRRLRLLLPLLRLLLHPFLGVLGVFSVLGVLPVLVLVVVLLLVVMFLVVMVFLMVMMFLVVVILLMVLLMVVFPGMQQGALGVLV